MSITTSTTDAVTALTRAAELSEEARAATITVVADALTDACEALWLATVAAWDLGAFMENRPAAVPLLTRYNPAAGTEVARLDAVASAKWDAAEAATERGEVVTDDGTEEWEASDLILAAFFDPAAMGDGDAQAQRDRF